jgi:hypothetical protein
MRHLAPIFLLGLTLVAACDEAPVTGEAKVTLDLVDLTYEFRNGRHTYNHNRRFTETGGVAVIISRGKVCVRNGEECVDALVKYRVDASQVLLQKGHHVATPEVKDTITLHYWAEDDAGNKFELHKVLKTDGEKVVFE